MPQLQQLELIVSSGGSENLLEGNQWEEFINKYLPLLSIFNFKFQIVNINRNVYNEQDTLAHFRSPFWLRRNPAWYVVYDIDHSIICTIDYFTHHETRFSSLFLPNNLTTLPIEKHNVYYDQIKELDLDSTEKSLHRYSNVQRLILSTTTIDESAIDLSKVTYLCVTSPSWSLKKLLRIIGTSMIHLNHFRIDYKFSETSFSEVRPLEQIRILDFSAYVFSSSEKENMNLISLFPWVERFKVGVSSLHDIPSIIDQLLHLSSGSFLLVKEKNDIWTNSAVNDFIRRSLTLETKRIRENSDFSYRLDDESKYCIHLWITSETRNVQKTLNTGIGHTQPPSPNETSIKCDCSKYCSLL